MAGFVIPLSEQLTIVNAIKTPFATGVLKLFQSAIAFTPQLVTADLTAIECDFTGYLPITLTVLPPAFIDPINGGVSFQIPTQQWDTDTPFLLANSVFGGWIESAGGALLMAWQINSPWMMDAVNKSLPLDLVLNFFGTDQVYVDIAGVPQ